MMGGMKWQEEDNWLKAGLGEKGWKESVERCTRNSTKQSKQTHSAQEIRALLTVSFSNRK